MEREQRRKRTEFMYLFINIFNKDRGRSNTMEERKNTGKSYLWALFAFLLAVATDQFTKWLAITYLKDQEFDWVLQKKGSRS